MYLRHLNVADFRSWPAVDLALDPGVTVLVGPNGQGKTNLIEAVGYLATLGSHRVGTDAPLVRAGAERAVVRGAVADAGRELRVEVEIVPGRANRARLNGSPVARPREILGALRTVLFAPEDLAVVRGDPGERRRFLDDLTVARAPWMAGVRTDYDRVLKQRAALLKSAGAGRRARDRPEHGDVSSTLDVWDGQLAGLGAQVLLARLEAVRALRPFAVDAYAEVAPLSHALGLSYSTALAEHLPALGAADGALPSLAELESALLAALAVARRAELERGVNLVGPHRDDLDLSIGALPVRGYASHGEGWSAALSLRLGSYHLLRTETVASVSGGDPVLVLDDVFAELDRGRRRQLAAVAGKAEQCLITAAVPGDVPEELTGTRVEVQDGEVRRV